VLATPSWTASWRSPTSRKGNLRSRRSGTNEPTSVTRYAKSSEAKRTMVRPFLKTVAASRQSFGPTQPTLASRRPLASGPRSEGGSATSRSGEVVSGRGAGDAASQVDIATRIEGMLGIYLLGRGSGAEAVPLLIETMRNPQADPLRRSTAAEALAGLGSQEAVPALIEVLQDREASGWFLRLAAASALSQRADSTALAVLATIVQDRTEATDLRTTALRSWVAASLAESSSKEYVALLIDIIRDPHEADSVRRVAIEVAGELKASKAIPTLLDALNDTAASSMRLRLRAIEALENAQRNRVCPIS
jgi:HEAT repeats